METRSVSVLPVPRYAIGQTVYALSVDTVNASHPCPDCLGTKEWTVTTKTGATHAVICLRCSSRAYGNDLSRDVPPLSYRKSVVRIVPLTVGSIKIETHPWHCDFVTYMCSESGVGSGRVYDETPQPGRETNALYGTAEEAQTVADTMTAALENERQQTPKAIAEADFASYPSTVAMERKWSQELYDAWYRARELKDAIQTIRDNEDGDYSERDAILDYLEEHANPPEWHTWIKRHPLDALIAAVSARLAGEGSDDDLRAALNAVIPHEKRESLTQEKEGGNS